MIGLLLASLLQNAPTDSPSAWREFDRRQVGFGETAFLYNRFSVRGGHAAMPTAWVSWDFHYSGRNPTTHVEQWQIDCARRRSRVVRGFTIDGEMPVVPGARRGGGLRPIAPGTPQAALAARLCRPAPGS
ncbi:MAG TPA: hypothetical protein VF693_08090 [Allosphingosinicella sp.]